MKKIKIDTYLIALSIFCVVSGSTSAYFANEWNKIMQESMQKDSPIQRKEEIISGVISRLKNEEPDVPALIEIFESTLEAERSASSFQQSIQNRFEESFWNSIEIAFINLIILIILVLKKCHTTK